MRDLFQGGKPPPSTPLGRFFGSVEAVCRQADLVLPDEVEADQTIWIKNEHELWHWVHQHLGIKIPTEQVCPDHVAPFTAFAEAYFARVPLSVWLASRAFGGKSVLLAALGLTEACTLGAGITLLGGSGEQSRRVHAYMEGTDTNLQQAFWEAPGAPRYLLKSSLAAWRTSLKNSGWIYALTASQKSVRGPHPQRLRMDEIDEMSLPILDAAMGQPLSKNLADGTEILSQTVLSSTHQNPVGTMTEILNRARERDWPIRSWCYKESMAGEHGWLSETEVARKKTTITVLMWDTEFELQEPSPEGRAFDPVAIDAMFNPELGEFAGGQGDVHVWEKPAWELHPDWPKQPKWVAAKGFNLEEMSQLRSSRRWRMRTLTKEEHGEWQTYWNAREVVIRSLVCRYAAGGDWGKKRDHTIIWVARIDCRPKRMVAYANLAREPYPIMWAKFNNLVARFDAQAAHDATGIGTAAEDFMEVAVIDVPMVGQRRKDLFNDYIVAVEDGTWVSPRIKYAYDEHRFTVQDDLWGTGHPPDSVVAGAMCNHAAMFGGSLLR